VSGEGAIAPCALEAAIAIAITASAAKFVLKDSMIQPLSLPLAWKTPDANS
jgi:hypothetical protein